MVGFGFDLSARTSQPSERLSIEPAGMSCGVPARGHSISVTGSASRIPSPGSLPAGSRSGQSEHTSAGWTPPAASRVSTSRSGEEAARVEDERKEPWIVDVDSVKRFHPHLLAVVVMFERLLRTVAVDDVLAPIGCDAPFEGRPQADVNRRGMLRQGGERRRSVDHTLRASRLGKDGTRNASALVRR
jgi:hypothetical protein